MILNKFKTYKTAYNQPLWFDNTINDRPMYRKIPRLPFKSGEKDHSNPRFQTHDQNHDQGKSIAAPLQI